jgi:alpha-D-ribose 1-methylphosphonate 5-triphosphate diphosphatase
MKLTLTHAQTLRPDGWSDAPVHIDGTHFVAENDSRTIDLSGFRVLPGLVDMHGDGFERHMAPRRGALLAARNGMIATEAELAANGITTAVLAQFFSWEGGMRGPDFAEHVFESIAGIRSSVATDLLIQLRLETHLLDDLTRAEAAIDAYQIAYVVLNDHLPHARLAEGRKPPRLTGQALKAGRNPDAHFEFLKALHARSPEVPAAMDGLCARLVERGLQIGSHDDHTAEQRATWRDRGARIAEFPETLEAAQNARDHGDWIVLGSPNVVRGASHAGNVSARDLVAAGLCDALASDYHYPAMRQAALVLADQGVCDLASAWHLISKGPADMLGLTDRGEIREDARADLVVLDNTHRVAATIANGQLTYLSGEAGQRFVA